jgi:Arc/MetJ-type ribon-helix-helix transcriptional regulator
MEAQPKITVSLPSQLIAEIDDARGDVPRSRVVRRALEAWLSKNERGSRNLPQERPRASGTFVREE